MTLDATDGRILAARQRAARFTNVARAEEVGLSPPPCLRRVRILEKAGLIGGCRATLDRAGPGLGRSSCPPSRPAGAGCSAPCSSSGRRPEQCRGPDRRGGGPVAARPPETDREPR
ncbi:Lrp/AsnC family transcriptional regulator [Methylobacterium crusticola]|nr:Lrp/AsnC family transcriptional regulator [Methylobacterium crusticola]